MLKLGGLRLNRVRPVNVNLTREFPGYSSRSTRSSGVRASVRRGRRPRARAARVLTAGSAAIACGVGGLLGATPAQAAPDPCPNAEFRVGPSAKLPDCRAYELVTPPKMGANYPHTATIAFNAFTTLLINPEGDSVLFQLSSGALPGFDAVGDGDLWRATRDDQTGWTTSLAGPTGSQAIAASPGGVTPDHRFGFWRVGLEGSLLPPGSSSATYLRVPDGSFELIGMGSLGQDPGATGLHIAAGGEQILFRSSTRLEPQAPSGDLITIYRRVPGEQAAEVVSLLPGEQTATASATYLGTSIDASIVAFRISNQIYVRVRDERTVAVGPAGATYAGISNDGSRVFYLAGGNLHAYDVASEQAEQLTDVGNTRVIHIAPDGSRAYFSSTSQIGGQGAAGQPNLYLWEEGASSIRYVATLAPADLTRTPGLGNWISDAVEGRVGVQASRSTVDGRVLVFESVARLTGADNAGHVAIYRYDAEADELACVSCREDGSASQADAALQEVEFAHGPYTLVNNLTIDGRVVVFESEDRLVPRDFSPTRDVYRWREGGQGDSDLALISSGQSPPGLLPDNVLWGITPDGSDIVFWTGDALVPAGRFGSTRALYTARVNGGLAVQHETGEEECSGDECQGAPSAPPADPEPGSGDYQGPGNPSAGEPSPPPSRCVRLRQQADRAAKRARDLRSKAKSASGKRARKLRKRAARQASKAKRLRAEAKRCESQASSRKGGAR